MNKTNFLYLLIIILSLSASIIAQSTLAPPTHPWNDNGYGIGVRNVTLTSALGGINKNTSVFNDATCVGGAANNYFDYSTTDQAIVESGASYNISVTLGSYCPDLDFPGGWPHQICVWIDLNNDGSLTDNEIILNDKTTYQSSQAVLSNNFTVPLTAVAGITTMRIYADDLGVSLNPFVNEWGEIEDYQVTINPCAANMIYLSSTTTQNNTATVTTGINDNEVIGIEIVTNNNCNPLSATSFTFNTTGSTNASGDISNATLYYSGTTATFSTSNSFGVFPNPNGSFTINGSQSLVNGTNYFWLAYDISSTGTSGNVVDAQCNSFMLSSGSQIPTMIVPAGNRVIQAPQYFINTYDVDGPDVNDFGRAMDVTSDEGYVIAGTTNPGPMFIMKLDRSGNIQWTKSYSNSLPNSISQTRDGGYIVTGEAPGGTFFIRLDAAGDTVWTKVYGPTTAEYGYDVHETADGGFILGDQSGTYDNSSYYMDALVTRLDANGNLLWTKTYGSNTTKNEYNYSLTPTADGNYVMVMWKSGGAPWSWVVKIDDSGNVLWEQAYNITQAYSIIELSGGGYLIGSVGGGLFKIQADGTPVWYKQYDMGFGTNMYFRSVQETADGGYMFALNESAGSYRHVLMVKTDVNGNFQWGNSWGSISTMDWMNYNAAHPVYGGQGMALVGTSGFYIADNTFDIRLQVIDQNGINCPGDPLTPTVTSSVITTTSFAYHANSHTPTSVGGSFPAGSASLTATVQCNVVMSVDFLSFDAQLQSDKTVKLNWETASESNNSHFVVQRSADGVVFENLVSIPGNGNAKSRLLYDYIDELPYTGTSYYRLKQVDYDGGYTYSEVRVVKIGGQAVTLYPNPVPAGNTIYLRLHELKEDNISVSLTDMLGNEVYNFTKRDIKDNVMQINTGNLPVGLYMYKLYTNSSLIATGKLSVQ